MTPKFSAIDRAASFPLGNIIATIKSYIVNQECYYISAEVPSTLAAFLLTYK